MCLNLIGSQFKNITEVETLLNAEITEKEILAMKNNRKEMTSLFQHPCTKYQSWGIGYVAITR